MHTSKHISCLAYIRSINSSRTKFLLLVGGGTTSGGFQGLLLTPHSGITLSSAQGTKGIPRTQPVLAMWKALCPLDSLWPYIQVS